MLKDQLVNKNVAIIELPGKQLYLVGTAHVSQSSVDLAEQVIREVKPDSVAIELCDSRYQSLKEPDRWKNTDIVKIIREGKVYVLLAQLVLAAFQKKLGDQLKIKPGAEMLHAAKVTEELGAKLVMADRDVRITLKRTWAKLGLWTMLKVLFAMVKGLFTKHEISQEEIERLKSEDALAAAMDEFSTAFPEVRGTLIDERDQYLAAKMREAPGSTIVAVVGAGHVPGIKNYLSKPIDIAALEQLPPKGPTRLILMWAIPALVIGTLAYIFMTAGAKQSISALEDWTLITGVTAAVGAALALAHPATVLVAFIVAPFTAINPFIRAGWLAGLMEAWLKKPVVGDFETVLSDLTTIRGIWRNRLSRVLLVVILTNLGARLGAILGIGHLIQGG